MSEADPRPPGIESLTPDQYAWAEKSEALWRRAHAIAQQHPECDAGDVYHALRCLDLTPSQRLAAGRRRVVRAERG